MLCWFLLYNDVNRLCVHMYPLPLKTPSHPPRHPSRPTRSAQLSSLCSTAASRQLSVSHTVVYACQCYSLSSSRPSSPHCVHESVHSPCLLLSSCPANSFISTTFLDSMYTHQHTILLQLSFFNSHWDFKTIGWKINSFLFQKCRESVTNSKGRACAQMTENPVHSIRE